jgi:hypothetical protein
MLHHQRRAYRVDGEHMLQVVCVQIRQASLGLALRAVQKAAGHDQGTKLQFSALHNAATPCAAAEMLCASM